MFTTTSEHTPFLHQVAGHNNDTVYFRSYRRRLTRPRRFVSSNLHASDLDDAAEDDHDCWSGSESDTPSDCEDAVQMHVSTVLKPLPSSSKGLRERCFYEYLNSALRARRTDLEWLRFFPRYYGALYAVQTDNQTPALLPAAPLTSYEPFSSDPVTSISNTDVSAAVVLEPTSSPSPPSIDSNWCEPSASYLHLEDLTACYTTPSLIDVKIGVHSYDPFECALGDEKKRDKVRRENEKCPSQLQTGFRICGARVWNWTETSGEGDSSIDNATVEIDGENEGEGATKEDIQGDYKVFDKYWCRSIALDDIEQPFWIFFGHTPSSSSPFPAKNDEEEVVQAVEVESSSSAPTTQFIPSPLAMKNARRFIPSFLDRLCQLEKLCTQIPKWRFYASSLLLCYETPNWNVPNQQLTQPSTVSGVHMIDFGHAYPIHMIPPIINDNGSVVAPPSNSPELKTDANYLHGIQSLVKLFRRMLHRAREEADPDVLREEQRHVHTVRAMQQHRLLQQRDKRSRRGWKKNENDVKPDDGAGNPSHCIPRRFSSLLSKFIVDRSILEGKVNSLLYDVSQNPHLYLKRIPQLRLSTLPSSIRKRQLDFITAQPIRTKPTEDSSLHSYLQSRSNLNTLWKLKLALAAQFDDGANTSFERPDYTIEDGYELTLEANGDCNAASNRPKHPRTQEWRQRLIAEKQPCPKPARNSSLPQYGCISSLWIK